MMPFVIRSEMCDMEGLARRPYGTTHIVRTGFLNAEDTAALSSHAYECAGVTTAGDIDTRTARPDDLLSLAPGCINLQERLAETINATGVFLGNFERSLAAVHERTDFLTSLGAPFHNDVVGHWPSCLFWVLALDVHDVEFVMPALGVRHHLRPLDLLVFDPCLAHGLCRPKDAGRSILFDDESPGRHQAFLSGELRLEPQEWATHGCPWLPHDADVFKGAVDLLMADIDADTGAAA